MQRSRGMDKQTMEQLIEEDNKLREARERSEMEEGGIAAPEGVRIRTMTMEDYKEVFRLWQTIEGFGIRSIDDSEAGIALFLARNPGLSVAAENEKGEIIGTILCGEDGRTGGFYHVCVRRDYRMRRVGTAMVTHCMWELKNRGINKISLIAFSSNDGGNAFWNRSGWKRRSDINTYEFVLNTENITRFVGKSTD